LHRVAATIGVAVVKSGKSGSKTIVSICSELQQKFAVAVVKCGSKSAFSICIELQQQFVLLW
jgi:uncharacterized protein YlxP (DUF503 family)